MPDIPVVGLDQAQNLIKGFDVGVLTGGVGALDPHQVPPQDADAQLVAEGELAFVLVGREGIPLRCYFHLLDAEVDPIDCHETAVEDIAFLLTVEVDLWCLEAAGTGCVRTGVEKIKAIHATKVMLKEGKSKVLKVNGAAIF